MIHFQLTPLIASIVHKKVWVYFYSFSGSKDFSIQVILCVCVQPLWDRFFLLLLFSFFRDASNEIIAEVGDLGKIPKP